MSGASGEASAIAALALAVRQAPARHSELLRGNALLPPGVGLLLRLAGGTSLQDLDPSLVSLAPEEDLRRAALFFIEEVLFRRDADHYRLLGLNPDATPEQIKEHHRLLMRMFHPDRDSGLEERSEQFATRANLAYNTLRDPSARADYDSSIRPQATKPVQPPRRPPMPARRRMVQPESFWSVRVHPLLMRYLPQWVLAGTALVSLAIVGGVYLSNPPVNLAPAAVARPDALSSGVKSVPDDEPAREVGSAVAAGEATGLDEVVAQFERRVAEAKASITEKSEEREEIKTVPAATPVPARPVLPAPKPAAVAAAPQPKPVPGMSPPAVARVQTAAATPPPNPPAVQRAAPAPEAAVVPAAPAVQPVPQKAPEPVPMIAAVPPTPVPVVEAAAPRAAPPDPNALLARFLEAYERGDIQACMALLDEDVRVDAGSKSELRREYDLLFRSTDLRHIKVTNMNWSRDGEFIRGQGRYRATFMRKGETVLRTQDGQVRVELVRRGSSALINELHYLASSRS